MVSENQHQRSSREHRSCQRNVPGGRELPEHRARPTLLVFTLGATAESARRRLLPERWGSLEVQLRQASFASALRAGRQAGCRIEVSSPRSPDRLGVVGIGAEPDERAVGEVCWTGQSGPDFGSRLQGAMSAAFARGGEPLVVVGTDVPDLTAEHVSRALERLEHEPDSVVVGPSPDGGIYLLAASRPIPGLATGVRWCCSRTLATLQRLLRDAGRDLILLSPLADLDRPRDLDQWLSSGGRSSASRRYVWKGVIAAVIRLLARLRRPPVVGPAIRLNGELTRTLHPRGPPLTPHLPLPAMARP